ncbi:DnaA regulatory inactivator Hda [Alkalilimnicola sp. S0819]|uniref:DnaA regulatory inactivator Hda n=1 Tax=Alkalilimnicola sp. S0819 TaxID=2613922 RepID=UPI001869C2AA|nr:DnaA regulatory inactivator Hda [Alkalilimnicola sp. S0819]
MPGRTSQLAFDFAWDAHLSLEDFRTGANGEVLEAIRALCAGSSAASVYLFGGRGLGKTHLLQGACRLASEQGQTVAYLPLRRAVAWPVQAAEGLERMDLVAVDDAQALRGHRAWQEALFHLYNRLREQGGRLLLAGELRPAELGLELADLVSRLQWGLTLRLQELDDADKAALLSRRAAGRGLELSEELGAYLLAHYRRDMPGLFALLDRLDAASLAEQRRLTVPFVKQVLGDGREGWSGPL